MLPPETIATTGGGNAAGSASTAATAATPAGSTTSLARSRQNSSARERSSSVTVRTSSTSWAQWARVSSPGEATAMPSAIVDMVGSGDRPAGGQGVGERRGALGLHGDDPDVGTAGLDRGRDPAEQPPAPGADDDGGDVRALVEDLQADRALAGDHVGVLERVDEHRAGALGVLGGGHERLGQGLPDELDLRAVGPGGRHLRQRRGLRHEHGRRAARAAGRPARRPARGCRRWRRRRRGPARRR